MCCLNLEWSSTKGARAAERLLGLGIPFDQPVLVALAFFMCRLLAQQSETLQQVRNLTLVACLAQPLNQVIQRRLVFRILVQSLSALFHRSTVVARLQVELRQHRPGAAKPRPQRDSFLS